MTMATSNDALATIAGLKQRVEWLEESIGRLLLAQEQNPAGTPAERVPPHNCCVTFTDPPPDLERAVTTQLSGHNCCVTFRSTKIDADREQRRIRVFVGLAFFAVMLLFFGSIFLSGLSSNSRGKMSTDTALKLD